MWYGQGDCFIGVGEVVKSSPQLERPLRLHRSCIPLWGRPGHPRLRSLVRLQAKTWVAGTSPAIPNRGNPAQRLTL
jgi:hypothetical protein